MNNSEKVFPFEFIEFIEGRKSSFIQNVEAALQEDLQSENKFGCKILDSHTHAGSKIHFKNFLEAELLFHNNYYNNGFAQLTVSRIQNELSKCKGNINHVILVGYESYSELFLNETKVMFEKETVRKDVKCDYCVHETHVRIKEKGERLTETVIRNIRTTPDSREKEFYISYSLINENLPAISLDNTLLVFIVPINTTLSTMDKIIAQFYDSIHLKSQKIRREMTAKSLLLSLITIGPSDLEKQSCLYWEKSGNILTPKYDGFIELRKLEEQATLQVETFAYVSSEWMYVHNKGLQHREQGFLWCADCYPDKSKIPHNLIMEKPIFDVPRGSVIPMLQLEQKHCLKPIKQDSNEYENLKKIWDISRYMSYRHIVKEGNHFQYFFDRVGFLNSQKVPIKSFLKEIRTSSEDKNINTKELIFNYIISPRQNGNAQWVDFVCQNLFQVSKSINPEMNEFDNVRTLYFEINKEYRSNLKAKYSDFFYTIEKICQSGQSSELRFHFVDETIVSGSTFIRALDLIHCLLMQIDSRYRDKVRVSLFHSVILIYGRSSKDSNSFYMSLLKGTKLDKNERNNLLDRFYQYVEIRIPSMRTHEDACILCKLVDDFRKIRRTCGTNQLAITCKEVINDHRPKHIENLKWNGAEWSFENYSFQCHLEKRLILFFSHLLNTRLSKNNEPLFSNEKKREQIDIASNNACEDIKEILKDYYENFFLLRIARKAIKSIMVFNTDEYKDDYSYLLKNLIFIEMRKQSSNLNSKKITQREKVFLEDELKKVISQNALLKAISRPFFTFHLRKRQAAFLFILEKLHELLNKYIKERQGNVEITKELFFDLLQVKVIFQALSDLNANYIIRNIKDYSPFKQLQKLADLGDALIVDLLKDKGKENDDKEKKKLESMLFSTNCFLMGIKKMSIMSQDSTKTLLLEANLIYDDEDVFFSPVTKEKLVKISSFCRKAKKENPINQRIGETEEQINIYYLSILGRLYLENNRILIRALEDLKYKLLEDIQQSKAYYLENFFDMCYLNNLTIGQEDNDSSVINIQKSYKKLRDSLEQYDQRKNYTLDVEIENWIKAFFDKVKCFKVISFVRDPEPKNELIQFYTLSKLDNREEDLLWFYRDDTVKKLKDLVKDIHQQDLVFSEDCALISFTRKNVAKEEFPKDNDGEKENTRKTIYIVLKDFNFDSQEHWFGLKLITTLREYFIKLIKQINLPIIISEKKQEFIKEALSISKAVSHGFQREHIGLDSPPESDYGLFYNMPKENGESKDLYFRYLQLITDMQIADWYRRALGVGENSIIGLEKENILEDKRCGFNLQNLLKRYLGLNGEIVNYRYFDANNKCFENVEIIFKIINDQGMEGNWEDCKNYQMSYFKVQNGSYMQNSFLYLLVIFVNNACKHSEVRHINVEINLKDRVIVISNQVEEMKDDCRKSLMNKMTVFPHLTKDESMTIWTLKHLQIRQKREWSIDFDYTNRDGKDYFQVKIKNIFPN